MKTIFLLLTVPFLFFHAYDVEASETEPILLNDFEEDVTGDGQLDKVELYGVLFSPETVYYRDIFSVIRSGEKEWRINYQGGYDPVIQFVDLNHDGISDIFYQSPTGGSGGLYTTRLDSLANGELTNMPLPEQVYVQGYFKDGFQAVIEIAPNTKPIVLNVEDRKDDYIRLGIFDEHGKLLKRTELMVDPIAFYEPFEISEQQGFGLKSYKQVSGAYHADGLGVIETLWYYEDGRWTALHTEWKEAGEYDASKFY